VLITLATRARARALRGFLNFLQGVIAKLWPSKDVLMPSIPAHTMPNGFFHPFNIK
jgi:hypothetical protein